MRCSRKLSFSTLEQAERTAAVVSSQRGVEGKIPVRVYECNECGQLHFSSKGEKDIHKRPSTVAALNITPLFTPSKQTEPAPQPASACCLACGGDGAKFELNGGLYHRKCRNKTADALERKRLRGSAIIVLPPTPAAVVQAPSPKPTPKVGGGVSKNVKDVMVASARRAEQNSWLKDKAREALSKLKAGHLEDAIVLLDAMVSLPKTTAPSDETVREFLEAREQEVREYLSTRQAENT